MFSWIKQRPGLYKIIKFSITGVLNTLVDFLVFTVLTIFWNPYVSQVCSYSAGVLNSYVINRSWTFRSEGKFLGVELVKFIVVNLISLTASLVLMWFLQSIVKIESELICKIPVTLATMVINFILSNLWVFRSSKSRESLKK